MEKLPKDLLEKIGHRLNTQDYLNTQQVFEEKLDSEEVWKRRFQFDFGFLYPYLNQKSKKDIKKTFLNLHDIIRTTARDNTQKILKWLGSFSKFLKSSYESELTEFLYSSFVDSLKYIVDEWKRSGMSDIHEVFIIEASGDSSIYSKIFETDFLPFPQNNMYDEFHDVIVDNILNSMTNIFMDYLNIPFVDSEDEVINEVEIPKIRRRFDI